MCCGKSCSPSLAPEPSGFDSSESSQYFPGLLNLQFFALCGPPQTCPSDLITGQWWLNLHSSPRVQSSKWNLWQRGEPFTALAQFLGTYFPPFLPPPLPFLPSPFVRAKPPFSRDSGAALVPVSCRVPLPSPFPPLPPLPLPDSL